MTEDAPGGRGERETTAVHVSDRDRELVTISYRRGRADAARDVGRVPAFDVKDMHLPVCYISEAVEAAMGEQG